MSGSPKVAILLAVHNGEPHLAEQLDSIAGQTHRNWIVLASDDGSRDNSRTVLEAFARSYPLVLIDGPRRGGTENFMSLLRRLPKHVPDTRWISFADQDDIWLPHKIERALAALSRLPEDRPALYCSSTWISDVSARPLRLSRPRPRPPSFRNALVQNICSGNTILLNPAAVALAIEAAAEVPGVAFHDWWLYQLVTGAEGQVVHDDEPTLFYRQHARNLVGSNVTLAAQRQRLVQLLSGHYREWNTTNIAALRASAHRLSKRNLAQVEALAAIRESFLPQRLLGMARLGLYRQSPVTTLAIWLAAALGRL